MFAKWKTSKIQVQDLLWICLLTMVTTVKAEGADNFDVILGVGVTVLIVLIVIWILLACCKFKMLFGPKKSKSARQEQYERNQQHSGQRTLQGIPAYPPDLEPWTVQRNQQQYIQQDHGYYAQFQPSLSPLPPLPLSPDSFGYGVSTPYTLGNTAPISSADSIAIPKPDYYYDRDISSPSDLPSPPYVVQQSSMKQTSFKLKPVPPPKPKKMTTPPPDY